MNRTRKREYAIYKGSSYAYVVMPMIPFTPRDYRPRPLWNNPRTSRPHFWSVYKSDLEESGPRGYRFTYDNFDFATQKEAKAAAERMAKEEKALALLRGNNRDG